ncbi:MAG: hypothetical protein Q9227_005235 [Pyrenula ochraceoflavens]
MAKDETTFAQKAWEIENSVLTIDPTLNALYDYPEKEHKLATDARPWKDDPHFFKTVRISALALLKMVMHARSGGSFEVMGLMQGYITANGEFIVTDAFRLPVEGTETRVNASEEANEYIINYLTSGREGGNRPENAVGWYHSHPGYGCWLSGIDVMTQMSSQSFQDPFCAVVIDPDRTVSAGKVEIGAFRTYPQDYVPPGGRQMDNDGFQAIPSGKVEDFGAHASQYYSLEVQHFKSTLDSELLSVLWNKYWVATLSQSPLLTNHAYATAQISDLALKVQQAGRAQQKLGKSQELDKNSSAGIKVVKDPDIEQVVKTSRKIAQEEMGGLMAEDVKKKLFFEVVDEARKTMGGNQSAEVAA